MRRITMLATMVGGLLLAGPVAAQDAARVLVVPRAGAVIPLEGFGRVGVADLRGVHFPPPRRMWWTGATVLLLNPETHSAWRLGVMRTTTAAVNAEYRIHAARRPRFCGDPCILYHAAVDGDVSLTVLTLGIDIAPAMRIGPIRPSLTLGGAYKRYELAWAGVVIPNVAELTADTRVENDIGAQVGFGLTADWRGVTVQLEVEDYAGWALSADRRATGQAPGADDGDVFVHELFVGLGIRVRVR